MSIDFSRKLTQQIGFIERSCKAFDSGHMDEALRIATAVRVLVHNTPKSTSLLNHLGALNINLSTTVRDENRSKAVFLTSMGRLRMDNTGTTWNACTDPDAIVGVLPLPVWWEQVVYVSGHIWATRRNLILGAATRDGGAHVDTTLTPEYEALMTTGMRGWYHYSPHNDGKFQPVMDSHLIYIRQMGFELLNSPELLALAA